MEDEESVAELLDRPQSKDFGVRDWTYERELLTLLVDSVQAMHATLIAANSEDGKSPDVKPLPRPKTAIERLEKRREMERHQARSEMLTPNSE